MSSYQVTEEQILKLNGQLKDASGIAQSINQTCSRFGIDQNARRVRYFVAQSFFETLSYTYWSENLNYTTAQRLVTVWPSRFSMSAQDSGKAYAPDYTNNPQKLANLVYANRDGNGNPSTCDGWNFRGRGAFHLTFRGNYQEYEADVYSGDGHIMADPDLVSQPADAFLSAGWFWNRNQMNALADADQFTQATKVINGSTATVPQRLPVLNKVNEILQW
jgi:putative chitinase